MRSDQQSLASQVSEITTKLPEKRLLYQGKHTTARYLNYSPYGGIFYSIVRNPARRNIQKKLRNPSRSSNKVDGGPSIHQHPHLVPEPRHTWRPHRKAVYKLKAGKLTGKKTLHVRSCTGTASTHKRETSVTRKNGDLEFFSHILLTPRSGTSPSSSRLRYFACSKTRTAFDKTNIYISVFR